LGARGVWLAAKRSAAERAVALGFAVAALGVALSYAWVVRRHAGALGLPLDDAFIYLTYAKQIARGHPFTYFDGGGYSPGATSPLWPFVIAPLWAVGVRGELLPAAVFVLGTLSFAATTFLVVALAGHVAGRTEAWCAGAFVLSCAPLSWAYLSGMETALGGLSVLLVCGALARRDVGSTTTTFALALAAAARPELAAWVALVSGAALVRAVRGGQAPLRQALLWISPLAPPLAWMVANRVLAGHFSPNTAISKSHFYLPQVDTAYYASTVLEQSAALVRELFVRLTSPLVPGALLFFFIGCRVVLDWGARHDRRTAALALISAAPVLLGAAVATAAQWRFQNFRYITVAFPAFLTVAGLGAGRILTRIGEALRAERVVHLVSVVAVVAAAPRLSASALLFAQGVRDQRAHAVAAGQWAKARLPEDARVALHDAGAFAYYSERRVFDVVGLVTNGQAEWCNHGPGARFESLERLAPSDRPTHFAYYGAWLLGGARDMYGQTRAEFSLPPPVDGAERAGPRLVGDIHMEIMDAALDLLGSGARPLALPGGWEVVDEVDVADLASERTHLYVADLGGRTYAQNSEAFSCFWHAQQPLGDGARGVADGGRTVRGAGGERFRVEVRPGRAARLVVRAGGPASIPPSEIAPVEARLRVSRADGLPLGELVLPPPSPSFSDVELELPSYALAERTLAVIVSSEAATPYRVFHYYVLQPDDLPR
jgi:hypothetical protein